MLLADRVHTRPPVACQNNFDHHATGQEAGGIESIREKGNN